MPAIANFLDTNVLVYSTTSETKAVVAQKLMSEPFVISAQALNEFANVGRRKLSLSWERITQIVSDLTEAAEVVVSVEPGMTKTALRLVQHYNLAFYDAVMISAALKAKCTIYYSEDLQHGLIIDTTLTIQNPFREPSPS
ncbi:PIN domain-containing protein [Rhizobiales bacterium RZME27]|jgi:predicted nucleic acid-binding protein|uniref:PIN domain-containing protein n=1 Tax=Endobacterium cereale TaxID=2663029 RepID=A0A6A8ACM6_9HYPH|nr:PIN domain-containing protein [Endobacterium cereale]MEB2846923.1 PIN domain-containing protein [Endobacterium cereale]MQY47658.1 PIN domain-containing protein [Endobacterium cereale]